MSKFVLDSFQIEAIAAIRRGVNVVVTAPTGSGKTLVAIEAIRGALERGQRAFYTTPIKALSNQKHRELGEEFGRSQTGLVTGDRVINPDAEVIVMTTEILRNRMYGADPELDALGVVIVDEIHFLQDAYRGPIWEEVIIGLPAHIQMVALSATVSNGAELSEWLKEVRGTVALVESATRPVPLAVDYAIRSARRAPTELLGLVPPARIPRPIRDRLAGQRPGGASMQLVPDRRELLALLDERGMTPVIWFILSRSGCERAREEFNGTSFTSNSTSAEIQSIVDRHTAGLDDRDRQVLGIRKLQRSLVTGIGVHHAGMLTCAKEAVEECFAAGLLTVVFATETLAMGINMPARSVVIDRITKFNGERHELLSPAQFTQMTGRAGRRGLDEVGYAHVRHQPFVDFRDIEALARSRSFELRSAFRPTYNMTSNLIRRMDRESAMAVLGQSFAQFQADRDVVRATARSRQASQRVEHWKRRAHCERGDIAEYQELVARIARLERRIGVSPDSVQRALDLVRPGDVISLQVRSTSEDTEALVACVLDTEPFGATVRLHAIDVLGTKWTVDPEDLTAPPYRLTTIDLSANWRHTDVVDVLEGLVADGMAPAIPINDELNRARAQLGRHPVTRCPELGTHLHALDRLAAHERRTRYGKGGTRPRTGTIAEQFEQVHGILEALELSDGWRLTARGMILSRLFHENDLMLALCINDGAFAGLSPADLAACVSMLTFEPRGSDLVEIVPAGVLGERYRQLRVVFDTVSALERKAGIQAARKPSGHLCDALLTWATTGSLALSLDESINHGGWMAGDFVRAIRTVIDVLRQFDRVTDGELAIVSRQALQLLEHGVVADEASRS